MKDACWRCLRFAVALACGISALSSRAETIKLEWRCNQTIHGQSTSAIRSFAELNLKFPPLFLGVDSKAVPDKVAEVWSKELKKLIWPETAAATDISSCVFDSIEAWPADRFSTFVTRLKDECQKSRDRDFCYQRGTAIASAMAKQTREFASQAPSRIRIPASVPGGRILWTDDLSSVPMHDHLAKIAASYDPKACEFDYSKTPQLLGLAWSREFLESFHPQLEKKYPVCRNALNRDLLGLVQYAKWPQECFDARGRTYPPCAQVREAADFLVGFLSQRTPSSEGTVLGQKLWEDLKCRTPEAGLGDSVLQVLKTPDLKSCLLPKEGESRIVTPDDVPGRFRPRPAYNLRRTGPKGFEALVPVIYRPETKNTEKSREYFQHCLSDAKKALIGPGGEQLSIRLEKPTGKTANASVHVVNLIEEGLGRSNSGKYFLSKTDCPLVIHETLHLLGLVDEYRELETGYKTNPTTGRGEWVEKGAEHPGYDCRSIGPDDSVMSNQQQAVCAALGCCEIGNCSRGPGASSCAIYEEAWLGGGGEAITKDSCAAQARAPNPNVGEEIVKYVEAKYLPPTRTSLLSPAQFNAIVKPGCVVENPLFYACGSGAYKSSQDEPSKKCPEVPRACRDGSWSRGK